MNGKHLTDFIINNKLENIDWTYSREYEQIEFIVRLTDVQWLEYVMYLDSGDSSITEVVKYIDEDTGEWEEQFGYVDSNYALEIRGLAE